MNAEFRTRARTMFDSVLYSYAQILFSNRRWFGALLLAVTFLKPEAGALGLAGVVICNVTAQLLRFDAGRITSGFYGFNGILFGAAYGYYLELNPFLLALFPIFVILTFLIAAVLENHLATAFNLPGLSLPFVLVWYVTVVFLRNYDFVTIPSIPQLQSAPTLVSTSIAPYFHALGLIFLQPHVLAGVALAIGILILSRVMLVLSLVGYLASTLFVGLLLPSQAESLAMIAGLNGALVAVALGGSLVIPSRKSLALAVIAALMMVIFVGFFSRLSTAASLPMLVLPFNAVTLATLYSLKFRQTASGLTLLYFAPGTPEENYYYHHTSQARFKRFRFLMPDLPVSGEWTISQGHDGHITHKADWRHALDFVVVDETGRTHRDGGRSLADYHCHRLPVTAPLDGEVALVVDGIADNDVGEMDLANNWGNSVIIRHAEGFYSALSHLEPGSLRVGVGQTVKRGEIIGHCGNSGRSPEPHLHFQFQATDKLGERTLAYPLGYFLEDRGEGFALRAAEVPAEGSRVQNLVTHRPLKDAFTFPYESDYGFECRLADGRQRIERWKVKVDMTNTRYLESSAGAWANFLVTDKVFYLTDFRGNRQSALYYFYLCAAQVPLGYHHGLVWRDVLPLSKVLRSWVRPLSEFFLLLGRPLQAEGRFRFSESGPRGEDIEITSELEIRGNGLFARYRRNHRGQMVISPAGEIQRFSFYHDRHRVFSAERTAGA